MFDREKYITSHANEILPVVLQITMWQCIEKWRVSKRKLDYLQVFKLSIDRHDDRLVQVIEHSQEQPKQHEIIRIECDGYEPINEKVYVIDDGNYSTMIMSSDY